MELDEIKNRFGIIGNDPRLNSAIDTAIQVAGTNLSVLITGESGVGKEAIPKIIHAYSPRKHNNYIAVNCGAIPEGTIESELFGHEKGSFTGANEARKGYFEVADKGTIFLDEVGELPLPTQARLLRVLETGDFIRVGSSRAQKTDVRVIAASNINFMHAISTGKFREDLYYRLNAIPIYIPPLRERKGDIHLLFLKFALDCADKYRMPAVRLTPEARTMLEAYRWPGNIRELKNVAERISVLESNRQITPEVLARYLSPDDPGHLPVRSCDSGTAGNIQDRDIIFKMLFQLQAEVSGLKSALASLTADRTPVAHVDRPEGVIAAHTPSLPVKISDMHDFIVVPSDDVEQVRDDAPKTIHDVSDDMIRKALEKHEGRRKAAAAELGISERTLYRKIKELKINDR
ncbi:MAG TPA: sigma-54 dependent transcriptional regulator [Candidatus Coprenecus pullistercoris]|nr:sigma-54 dependent transcriptional regulator [Candidatus Coprenecus pullistercoris]